ncbi:MAG TPA: hypothetical protein VLT33_13485, partial [Labilithrix sp.]|nr:hypothetical protein [Labilithrix sp.]
MTDQEREETMPAAIDCSLLQPRSSLDLAFRFGAGRLPGGPAWFVALAFAMHGGLAMAVAVRAAPPAVAELTSVTEVDLPPPPPPEPEKVAPPGSREEPAPAAKRFALPPPPQAARAGALLTAKVNAPSA